MTPQRNTIAALDADFRGMQSVFNWCQDFEMELGNAGLTDPAYDRLRIRYCREFLEAFADVEWSMRGNFLRAEAGSYWWLGDIETADARFEALIQENPDWAWGYIEWSDLYWMYRDSPRNYARGEAILKRALARRDLEDRGDVLARLRDLRAERARAREGGRARHDTGAGQETPAQATKAAGEMNGLKQIPFQISYGPGDDRLHRFYIPALQASVRYDRMAGFFTSSALAVAAAGGRMRLLVGAQLSREDVEAIRAGHEVGAIVAARLDGALPAPQEIADRLLRDRLAALAWMVAAGALEIRVVLPLGSDGLPLAASESQEYFHPKVGIFTDAQGDRVAFSGSINESETAWERNYEQFYVFHAWTEEGRLYVAEAIGRFERLWTHREPDWIALPIPEASRQKLLRYTPSGVPVRDPLECEPETVNERAVQMALAPALQQERVLLRFLRDAPHLAGATGLGAAIEEMDILDLEGYLAQTGKTDIQLLYQDLAKGSRNHLRAFVTNLKTGRGDL